MSHSPTQISMTTRCLRIIPSAVSGARVLIAALLILMIDRWPDSMLIAACVGVPLVFVLDAIDGILARHLHCQTLTGSFVDIAADRAVEFIFLQHFVGAGLVPGWLVLIFYFRILLTDGCRVLAFRMDRVSANGIQLPSALRPLVLSKVSRSAYGALKGILFTVLMFGMHHGDASISLPGRVLMFGVAAFSIVRASPIVITYFPLIKDLLGADLLTCPRPSGCEVIPWSTKILSCLQLGSDFCLATWLLLILRSRLS